MLSIQSHRVITNPILDKITDKNISELIDIQDKHDKREYNDKNFNRIFILLGVVIVGIFIIILKNYPDLLKTIVVPLISLLLGGIGGYGYGYKKGKDSNND